MAQKKRVEIVKVTVVGPDGTAMEVDGKACTKCGEVKALTEFHAQIRGLGGRMSRCSSCKKRYIEARRVKINPDGRRHPRGYWTTESFESFLRNETEGDYVLIGKYAGVDTLTTILHTSCGIPFYMRPKEFTSRGSRCPKCTSTARAEGKRKTQAEFIKEVYAIVGDEYQVLGEFGAARVPIRMLHRECGREWRTTPYRFLNRGARCPECSRKVRVHARSKTHVGFLSEVHKAVGNEYSVLGDYINNRQPILMRHNVCGHEWGPIPSAFTVGGTRCPQCAESRGERRVREYLTANSYAFTPQHKIDELRDTNPLPFDFAVHFCNYDVLIEYDGEQHFRPVDFAGKGARWAERRFRETKRRDRIKNDYCRANGIDLIRIRYDQFDEIETILDRRLSALGVTGSHPTEEIANITKEVA